MLKCLYIKWIKVFSILILFIFLVHSSTAQEISGSFELRYFTKDTAANGITDFHGETETLNTGQRIDFLRQYGNFARKFFEDPDLNTRVVPIKEVDDFFKKYKKQPLPLTRRRIPLESWKFLGFKNGQHQKEKTGLLDWEKKGNVRIQKGSLQFTKKKANIQKAIPAQTWRMYAEFDLQTSSPGNEFSIKLVNGNNYAVNAGVNKSGLFYYVSGGNTYTGMPCKPDSIYTFKLEIDLKEHAYNLFVNDQLVADFVALTTPYPTHINSVVLEGDKNVCLDNLYLVGYAPTDEVRVPYEIKTLIDEDFQVKPDIKGWNMPDYEDNQWTLAELPVVHGGERFEGEDLFLRKKIFVDKFHRAELNIETLDPGGKIWINGEIAAVIQNRHPVKLNISKYLKPDSENLICLQVNAGVLARPSFHAASDHNIGWFAGRAYLDLTSETFIDDVFAYAETIYNPAVMSHRIELNNELPEDFKGSISIKYYPWFPNESSSIAADSVYALEVRATSRLWLKLPLRVTNPELWSFQNPLLYKVVVELKNEQGDIVDDYVFTAGIRTVSQEGGTFRINGKPEMLNGAQTIGFHLPPDKLAMWIRCKPAEIIAEELLMIGKMNGNLLRIHDHAEEYMPGGINDPRIAEMADQMGVMLIWLTPAWIRNGEWCNIDFEGYPRYMKQVYNHPSIVMWEVSNHPWSKKKWDIEFYNRFYEKVYRTLYPVDPSRLISATSHIRTTYMGNDAGTIDSEGNPIKAAPEYTALMVTRGNQDSYTGYGRKWSDLRKFPDEYVTDFLKSPDRAYFNFEHEESIGQPNWSLAKGKPWYKLQSYEWDYDTGSIGRKLGTEEWLESQAWQAFSAWESMKKQRIFDYDGFSWCPLNAGANMGTYKKPLVDEMGNAKLAFYANKMIFQRTVAGSDDVDIVYGPNDIIRPVIMNLDDSKQVDLTVTIQNSDGKIATEKEFKNVTLREGRNVTYLPAFKPELRSEGFYFIKYQIVKSEK